MTRKTPECFEPIPWPRDKLPNPYADAKPDLDFQGIARDLAHSLSEANRNIDRLAAGLIETAETFHKTHSKFAFKNAPGDSWQECSNPLCRKVADLLASLLESEKCGDPE